MGPKERGSSTVRAGDMDRIVKYVYISSSPQRSSAQANVSFWYQGLLVMVQGQMTINVFFDLAHLWEDHLDLRSLEPFQYRPFLFW